MVHGPHGVNPAGFGSQGAPQPAVNTKLGLPQVPPKVNATGFNPMMHTQNPNSQAHEADPRPEKLHYQSTFGGPANLGRGHYNKNRNVIEEENPDACQQSEIDVPAHDGPAGNLFHSKTLDKCPNARSKKEFGYDSDDYIHNTTGNKDRKKRKIKTLVLSGQKLYQNEMMVATKVNHFCPDHHALDQPMNQ